MAHMLIRVLLEDILHRFLLFHPTEPGQGAVLPEVSLLLDVLAKNFLVHLVADLRDYLLVNFVARHKLNLTKDYIPD